MLYNKNEQRFIPAESVYAVFEVKQTLNRKNVLYAGKKVSSVRRLYRTSAVITHAGGKHEPKQPFNIIGGILTYDSEWKPSLGKTFTNTLKDLKRNSRLDIGCVANAGIFDVLYLENKTEVTSKPSNMALASFMFHLLGRLQALATVSAIDYTAYNKWLT